MVDDDLKVKANPTIILILDYLAIGVLLGLLAYGCIVAHVVSPDTLVGVITGILGSFGVYKATS